MAHSLMQWLAFTVITSNSWPLNALLRRKSAIALAAVPAPAPAGATTATKSSLARLFFKTSMADSCSAFKESAADFNEEADMNLPPTIVQYRPMHSAFASCKVRRPGLVDRKGDQTSRTPRTGA